MMRTPVKRKSCLSVCQHFVTWIERKITFERKSLIVRKVISLTRHLARTEFAIYIIARYVEQNIKIIGTEASESGSIKLLVLNEERYRADLEVLAARPDVELYSLPSSVQQLLNAIWLSEVRAISIADPDAYLHNRNPLIQKARHRLHLFLTRLIGLLAKRNGFDGITSCTFYYRQDREWESAGHEIGVPFFALHKENMKDPVTHNVTIERYKRKAFRFEGNRLFLVNRLEKEVILKAGCATEDKIAVVGALRMDTLYRRVKKGENQNFRDKVVLFSTHHRLGLLEIDGVTGLFNHRRDAGFIRHFSMLHGTFAKIALERPNTNFVIKTKWLGIWYDEIVASIKEVVGVDPQSIPNLMITDLTPAQDLIDSAMVVVGLNSTTLLEAKLARVPVIIPLIEEAAEKYFESNVYFQKYMDIFSVASSPEELCNQLRMAIDGLSLHQDDIPDSMIRDYLGYFDGGVADRVVDIMKQDIESARKLNSQMYCERK